MATLIDSYSESNQDTSYTLSSQVGDQIGVGQSFTSTGGTLDSAKFYLKKTLSPTGNAVATIYAHTGTFGSTGTPTGSVLATSDNFDVSTLTTSYQLITFNFSGVNRIALTDTTKYFLCIEYSGGDSSNKVNVGVDATAPTATGNGTKNIATVWSAVAQDFPFYVYKETSSFSPSISPSQSPSASISPSISPSQSLSASISVSISPSVSPSLSPSVSQSTSPSISVSVSPSQSQSQSPSISTSVSPSLSTSISPSISPSVSVSISPSVSPSISPSISPSQSPSASISPSVSPSLSQSLSPSASPSVSPSISIPLKPHGWIREFRPSAKLASVTPRVRIE